MGWGVLQRKPGLGVRWFSRRTKRVIVTGAGDKVLLSWGPTPQTFTRPTWKRSPGRGLWEEVRELMQKQFIENGCCNLESLRPLILRAKM